MQLPVSLFFTLFLEGRGSVQDWSLQCPSNAIWLFNINLFQKNPSKCNPELEMKMSLEVPNIDCPSSTVHTKIDQSILTASYRWLLKWQKKVYGDTTGDRTRVTHVTTGNTYHYSTTTHGRPWQLIRPTGSYNITNRSLQCPSIPIWN
jgi:hypothetical protein